MEFLDIFLLCAGILVCIDAVLRLVLIHDVESFKNSFEDAKAEGNPEDSISFKLRNEPLFLDSENRGI